MGDTATKRAYKDDVVGKGWQIFGLLLIHFIPKIHVGRELSGTIPMRSGIAKGLRDRPTLVSSFREQPPKCPQSTYAALFR